MVMDGCTTNPASAFLFWPVHFGLFSLETGTGTAPPNSRLEQNPCQRLWSKGGGAAETAEDVAAVERPSVLIFGELKKGANSCVSF